MANLLTTYKYGGTSVTNGKTKVRYASDLLRIKSLSAHNNSDIDFVELPKPMTRVEVAQHLLDIKYKAHDQSVIDACNNVINNHVLSTPKRKKSPQTVNVEVVSQPATI